MAFDSRFLEIQVGNIESRLMGPTPRQRLDRALNPHLRVHRGDGERRPPEVYSPTRDVVLTGALPLVKRTLRRAGMRFRLRDLRHCRTNRPIWQLRGIELRDYQLEVIERALAAGSGLVDIGTGGGKTALAAAIIARLGLPTLYLVTTRTLLQQTITALSSLLGVTPGVIGDGVNQPERLTVALIQSLDPERVELETWSGGTLIFDEGHHAAAGTYQELIRRIGPRYHYYLSAVPWRSGDDQVVLDALVGSGGRLTGGRYSARFLLERGYACPVEVVVERCRITGDMMERPFHSVYREFIVHNHERNERIADIVRRESWAGRSVLVLVDHVRHGREVERRLTKAPFVHGATPRGRLHETVAAFAAGECKRLIATAGLFMEGVSINGIECLVMAGGLKSRAKVLQSVGRGMRRAPGKKACRFYDFFDDDEAGVLRRHARRRLQVLKEEGFLVPAVESAAEPGKSGRPIPPSWAHIAGTRRFALVTADGDVRGKALCLRRQLVPEDVCRRCKDQTVCERGGMVLWLDDQA